MKHKHHNLKKAKHLNRNAKRLAAVAAGTAIMSAALLPGMPAVAHASAGPGTIQPNIGTPEKTVSAVQVENPSQTTLNVKLPPLTKKVNKVSLPQSLQQKINQTNVKQAQSKTAVPAGLATTTQTDAPLAKTASNAPTNYKQVLDITATAYAPGPHDNDQWGNKTYMGTQIRPGVIAVDPSVIPLGSRVYIEYPDGTGSYAIAEDTGGAIKGNRIDIAKWTVAEAQDFGMQQVKVYVLDGGVEQV